MKKIILMIKKKKNNKKKYFKFFSFIILKLINYPIIKLKIPQNQNSKNMF